MEIHKGAIFDRLKIKVTFETVPKLCHFIYSVQNCIKEFPNFMYSLRKENFGPSCKFVSWNC
jgi:hypothetical protein